VAKQKKISRDELWGLYRISIDEYRYCVQLNNRRMEYYVVLNSGLVAVATGLLSSADMVGVKALAGAIFLIGIAAAIVGISAIYRSRDYYHATVLKKTLCEELLGLNIPVQVVEGTSATLAIGTTSGQQDVQAILAGRPRVPFFTQIVKNQIVTHFMWILACLALVDLIAVSYAVFDIAKGLQTAAAAMPTPFSDFDIVGCP
jgi:hypothetical protein